jgi:tetratricopeptide (TPR) repeat protein
VYGLAIFAGIVAIILLTAFIYLPMSLRGRIISCSVFLIALGFFISNFTVTYNELKLPWQVTYSIGSSVVKSSPLLGICPNQFSKAYISYRPAWLNNTPAWNIEFTAGTGFIPTIFATEGILSMVSWLTFLVCFGIYGFRIFRNLPKEKHSRFFVISSYIASVFGLCALIISLEPHALLLLVFIMLGISVGTGEAYVFKGSEGKMELVLPRTILYTGILLIIFLLGTLFVYTKNFISIIYFNKGIDDINSSNNIISADADMGKALSYRNLDILWRGRTEIGLQAIQKIYTSVPSGADATTTTRALNSIMMIANQDLGYAKNAVNFDPNNYYNYLAEAGVLSVGANLNVAGAYDEAVTAYSKAIGLNPTNPSIYLALAQLQASQNKLDDSLESVISALQLKNNYIDALSLILRIYISKGDVKNAVTAVEASIQADPTNPLPVFQLGVLLYSSADYADAVLAFEKALSLQPVYANASYLLGLTYARLNKVPEALNQFEIVQNTNPDNKDLNSIITSLKQGKSIFTSAVANPKLNTLAPKTSKKVVK